MIFCHFILYSSLNIIASTVSCCPGTRSVRWCSNLSHGWQYFFKSISRLWRLV